MPYAVTEPAVHGTGEKELLAPYVAGDQEAFHELVDRYRDSVYAFLTRFLGRSDLVDDVFQETLMQMFLNRQRFDVSRPLRPWLFSLAANKARDALRRVRRTKAVHLGNMCDDDRLSVNDVLDFLRCDMWMPYDNLDRKETAASVQRVVAEMPEKFREILRLAYFQKLSYAEIAEILDIPVGTVKSRLHTAVAYFAECWHD
jgi:RNA polymerase sigma-70 factor (ECF subfamily)